MDTTSPEGELGTIFQDTEEAAWRQQPGDTRTQRDQGDGAGPGRQGPEVRLAAWTGQLAALRSLPGQMALSLGRRK